MKSKFLNLKEFVLVIVLSCLMIGIGYLILLPFAANMQLLYFLEPGLIGLVNGIVYVLMIRKCPKIAVYHCRAVRYLYADHGQCLCRSVFLHSGYCQ